MTDYYNLDLSIKIPAFRKIDMIHVDELVILSSALFGHSPTVERTTV